MSAQEARREPAPGSFERWLRGFLNEEGNNLLDRTLAEHAHELAEKIRSASACYRGSNDCGDPDCVGRMAAADLIDPEVADG